MNNREKEFAKKIQNYEKFLFSNYNDNSQLTKTKDFLITPKRDTSNNSFISNRNTNIHKTNVDKIKKLSRNGHDTIDTRNKSSSTKFVSTKDISKILSNNHMPKKPTQLDVLYQKLQNTLVEYINKNKNEIMLFGSKRYEGRTGDFYLKTKTSQLNSTPNNNLRYIQRLSPSNPWQYIRANNNENEGVIYINGIKYIRKANILTPIPIMNKRYMKNCNEVDKFFKAERTAVHSRRIEYSTGQKKLVLVNTIDYMIIVLLRIKRIQRTWRNFLLKKCATILIQSAWKGYSVRKRIALMKRINKYNLINGIGSLRHALKKVFMRRLKISVKKRRFEQGLRYLSNFFKRKQLKKNQVYKLKLIQFLKQFKSILTLKRISDLSEIRPYYETWKSNCINLIRNNLLHKIIAKRNWKINFKKIIDDKYKIGNYFEKWKKTQTYEKDKKMVRVKCSKVFKSPNNFDVPEENADNVKNQKIKSVLNNVLNKQEDAKNKESLRNMFSRWKSSIIKNMIQSSRLFSDTTDDLGDKLFEDLTEGSLLRNIKSKVNQKNSRPIIHNNFFSSDNSFDMLENTNANHTEEPSPWIFSRLQAYYKSPISYKINNSCEISSKLNLDFEKIRKSKRLSTIPRLSKGYLNHIIKKTSNQRRTIQDSYRFSFTGNLPIKITNHNKPRLSKNTVIKRSPSCPKLTSRVNLSNKEKSLKDVKRSSVFVITPYINFIESKNERNLNIRNILDEMNQNNNLYEESEYSNSELSFIQTSNRIIKSEGFDFQERLKEVQDKLKKVIHNKFKRFMINNSFSPLALLRSFETSPRVSVTENTNNQKINQRNLNTALKNVSSKKLKQFIESNQEQINQNCKSEDSLINLLKNNQSVLRGSSFSYLEDENSSRKNFYQFNKDEITSLSQAIKTEHLLKKVISPLYRAFANWKFYCKSILNKRSSLNENLFNYRLSLHEMVLKPQCKSVLEKRLDSIVKNKWKAFNLYYYMNPLKKYFRKFKLIALDNHDFNANNRSMIQEKENEFKNIICLHNYDINEKLNFILDPNKKDKRISRYASSIPNSSSRDNVIIPADICFYSEKLTNVFLTRRKCPKIIKRNYQRQIYLRRNKHIAKINTFKKNCHFANNIFKRLFLNKLKEASKGINKVNKLCDFIGTICYNKEIARLRYVNQILLAWRQTSKINKLIKQKVLLMYKNFTNNNMMVTEEIFGDNNNSVISQFKNFYFNK